MRDACGETKIDELDALLRLIEQDILQLYVSVCYVSLMAIVYRLDDLTPQELSFKLRHLPVGLHLQVAMQAASIDILHHEEDLFMALEHLKKLRDVLMVQLLHNLHLSLNRLTSIRLHQLSLLVDLDSNFLVE